MTDDAAYYQAHKDDPDEWGEPVAPVGRVRPSRPSHMHSVRFDPEAAIRLRQAADLASMSVSELIRTAVSDWIATLERFNREEFYESDQPPLRTYHCQHMSIGPVIWARCDHDCEMQAA